MNPNHQYWSTRTLWETDHTHTAWCQDAPLPYFHANWRALCDGPGYGREWKGCVPWMALPMESCNPTLSGFCHLFFSPSFSYRSMMLSRPLMAHMCWGKPPATYHRYARLHPNQIGTFYTSHVVFHMVGFPLKYVGHQKWWIQNNNHWMLFWKLWHDQMKWLHFHSKSNMVALSPRLCVPSSHCALDKQEYLGQSQQVFPWPF